MRDRQNEGRDGWEELCVKWTGGFVLNAWLHSDFNKLACEGSTARLPLLLKCGLQKPKISTRPARRHFSAMKQMWGAGAVILYTCVFRFQNFSMAYCNYYTAARPCELPPLVRGSVRLHYREHAFYCSAVSGSRNSLALIYQGFEISVCKFAIEVNEI